MQGSGARDRARDRPRGRHGGCRCWSTPCCGRDAAGTPIGVRTTVFDATDRRQYERELLAARRRAEQATSWVRAVEQVVADLAAVAGAAEVSEVVARAGTAVFGARRSAVWLVDAATGSLQLVAGDADLSAPVWPAEVTDEDGLVLTPIEAGERALGLLVLERSTEHPLDPDELSLLKTLGRQAGQALERALLYDEQRRVATTLQHSLLPRTLPDDPRLGLSACYRPAVEGLEVGGDWYDAFLLDPDRVAVVVGDVVGRGLAAAAVMGQLRSAVRALAGVDSGPSHLLARLDRFVDGVPAAETATLAYAELDLRDGRARYACAGHPPPVLVDPAGRAVLLWDGRSAPLGAHFGGDHAEAAVTLVPGSRLALTPTGWWNAGTSRWTPASTGWPTCSGRRPPAADRAGRPRDRHDAGHPAYGRRRLPPAGGL